MAERAGCDGRSRLPSAPKERAAAVRAGQAVVAGGRGGVSIVIATPEILAHGSPTAVAQTPNYYDG